MGNPFFDFLKYWPKRFKIFFFIRNMYIFISNVLSKSILDFGKGSNWKYVQILIYASRSFCQGYRDRRVSKIIKTTRGSSPLSRPSRGLGSPSGPSGTSWSSSKSLCLCKHCQDLHLHVLSENCQRIVRKFLNKPKIIHTTNLSVPLSYSGPLPGVPGGMTISKNWINQVKTSPRSTPPRSSRPCTGGKTRPPASAVCQGYIYIIHKYGHGSRCPWMTQVKNRRTLQHRDLIDLGADSVKRKVY